MYDESVRSISRLTIISESEESKVWLGGSRKSWLLKTGRNLLKQLAAEEPGSRRKLRYKHKLRGKKLQEQAKTEVAAEQQSLKKSRQKKPAQKQRHTLVSLRNLNGVTLKTNKKKANQDTMKHRACW